MNKMNDLMVMSGQINVEYERPTWVQTLEIVRGSSSAPSASTFNRMVNSETRERWREWSYHDLSLGDEVPDWEEFR